jgi:hypothetical protein
MWHVIYTHVKARGEIILYRFTSSFGFRTCLGVVQGVTRNPAMQSRDLISTRHRQAVPEKLFVLCIYDQSSIVHLATDDNCEIKLIYYICTHIYIHLHESCKLISVSDVTGGRGLHVKPLGEA